MMAPTFPDRFLGKVYDAVVNSPNWERTVLVVTYDEWGGFFDHLPRPVGEDPNPALGAGLRDFCVPFMVISPRARRGHVDPRSGPGPL